jgi:hypothetical protein
MALKYLYLPSGVKAGTAYGVMPNSADADFDDFTRNSASTRIDKNGFITDVEVNVPRLDYTGGGCPSLLLEPASTNLTQYSKDFTQSYWTKENNATIESDVEISPTGGLNASYLKAPVGTGISPRISQTFGCASGQTYTGSVFVKKDNIDYIRLLSTGATASTLDAYYNVSNGILGNSGSPDKAKIEDYGNGWYRLSLVINTTQNTGSATFRIQLAKGDNNPASTYEGTEKSIIFGAQLEQQSYATSYIPTNGSSVTRAADVGGGTGDLSNVINSTEGVLYAEIAALADDATYRILSLSNGTACERVYMQYTNASNTVSVVVKNGCVTQANMVYVLDDATNFSKVAIKYKANDFALWVNGVERNTDTSGSVPTGLNTLAFNNSGGTVFYGNVKSVAVFKEALSDTELQELTTL